MAAVQAGLSAFILDGFSGEHLEWEVELDDEDEVRRAGRPAGATAAHSRGPRRRRGAGRPLRGGRASPGLGRGPLGGVADPRRMGPRRF